MNRIRLSARANPLLRAYLTDLGWDLTLIDGGQRTYDAVSTHADLFCCRMGAGEHAEVFMGDPEEVGFAYPHNVKYNAVCLDRYFIHNLKYTSPALLQRAQDMGLMFLHVRQGYTKCNMVVVDGHSIITSDKGMMRALSPYTDLDILPVRQGYVKLTGFSYGFLGGASGRAGNAIIFNGDLSAHPDCDAICRFITERGLSVRYFPAYPLEDIGSIIAE